jgi:hypothetical protein
MVAIANGVDFISAVAAGNLSGKVDKSGLHGANLCCYAGFLFFWFLVWGNCSSLKFSAILTGASCVQCLGFLLLTLKVRGQKSVSGLSSRTLNLFVIHLASRLVSTSLKNGYIPMDKTGDYMYQVIDACTLALVVHLVYCVHKSYAHTYQEEYDTLPLEPLVAGSFILAVFVHGHMNRNFFFDSCWAFSMNLEMVVLLPQLWMMAKMGGKVDPVTAHFVACVVTSTVLSFTFWWFNFRQLEKKGAHIAAKAIIGAQALKLIFSADFMFYYVRAYFDGGSVILPAAADEAM